MYIPGLLFQLHSPAFFRKKQKIPACVMLYVTILTIFSSKVY